MKKIDKKSVWYDVLESVRVSVSPAIFQTWLTNTHLASLRKLDKKRYLAEIGCQTPYVKTTVEKRYFGILQDALMRQLEMPCDLTFVVQQNKEELIKNSQLAPLFEERDISEEVQRKLAKAKIRPGFTFENFAVSGSNQMAWAAAEAISKEPGRAYNPLFIWGGVGVGKTHLMLAVGVNMLKKNLDSRIVVCTGEEFTNDIVEGIRNKSTQVFRDKYRKLNALFVDDIQFIAGKDAVQEEFFHTFNAVTNAGGQIILTSDRPPGEISKLEDRLRSRFEAGLIVDIAPPDFELRCAITQIKAKEKGIELETEHVHMIAGNAESARKIEGLLVRLASEVKLKNAQVSEDLITNVLGKGVDSEERKTKATPDKMIEAVCTHYSIGKRALLGKARSKSISTPRQILMYLLRTELNLPLEEVGRLTGGRDHSTVIHGVDKVTRLASNDVNVREDILRIKGTF